MIVALRTSLTVDELTAQYYSHCRESILLLVILGTPYQGLLEVP